MFWHHFTCVFVNLLFSFNYVLYAEAYIYAIFTFVSLSHKHPHTSYNNQNVKLLIRDHHCMQKIKFRIKFYKQTRNNE